MAAVPVIMDRIRHNVMEKIKEGPRLLQVFFSFAYSYKLKQLKLGYDTPLLNKYVLVESDNNNYLYPHTVLKTFMCEGSEVNSFFLSFPDSSFRKCEIF